jgi:polyisoprenyl-phosphate glycosyltransferase
MNDNKDFLLSLVIPLFNEEENIQPLYDAIDKATKGISIEIIFVDDGSKDKSLAIIKNLSQKDDRIQFLSFSRNFGHQNALKAGIDYSKGDCVISMDADLQHPPKLIPELILKWKEGYDVVYTIRKYDKKTSFFKKITASFFYSIIKNLSKTKIEKGAADFRLLDKKIIKEIKALKENYLFLRGMVSWMGFSQSSITYIAPERQAGKTKYSFRKMIKFAFSGITSFSTKPLQLSTFFGFLIAGAAFLYALYAMIAPTFTDVVIEKGWTSVIVSVLFIGGIQLIMIGILGEYLGKLFIENKRRPNYIIKEKNIKEENNAG